MRKMGHLKFQNGDPMGYAGNVRHNFSKKYGPVAPSYHSFYYL